MCGRFGLFARLDAIQDRFHAEFRYEYEPRYNIAPEGAGVAAIRDDTPTAIDRLRWGLVPHWVDDRDGWPRPINARAESIDEKPAFRAAFGNRRCLLPANGYYEWTGHRGRRVPHWITVDDAGLFAMAGIWETWGEGDDEFRSVAIITTDANDAIDGLHDRMPVILEPDEEKRWLTSTDRDELTAMLDPYPGSRTAAYEVPRAVNDPRNDSSELIRSIGGEQTGLGDF